MVDIMLKNKAAALIVATILLVPWAPAGNAQGLLVNQGLEAWEPSVQQEAVSYSIFSLPFKIAGKVVKKAAEVVVTAPIKKTKMEIKAAKEAAKLAKKAVKTAKKVTKAAEKIHEKTDGKDKDGNPVKKKDKDIQNEDFKKAPELKLPEAESTLPPIIVERPEGEEVKAGSEAKGAPEATDTTKSPATNESQVSKPSEVSQQELEENKPLGFRESANRYKAQQEAAAKQAEQERLEKERAAQEEGMSSFRKAASRYKAQQEAAQE